MNAPVYKITNILPTSVTIEDINITLQARGGKDASCVISSDSYNRSSSLKELLKKKWVTGNRFHMTPPQTSKPTISREQPKEPQPSIDISALQNEIRTMHSRFDEVLEALRSVPRDFPQAPAPVIVHVPVPAGSYNQGIHSNTSSDPIFIPSNIVPKNADVHISTSEESSSGDGFDDSLAALKAARKKK